MAEPIDILAAEPEIPVPAELLSPPVQPVGLDQLPVPAELMPPPAQPVGLDYSPVPVELMQPAPQRPEIPVPAELRQPSVQMATPDQIEIIEPPGPASVGSELAAESVVSSAQTIDSAFETRDNLRAKKAEIRGKAALTDDPTETAALRSQYTEIENADAELGATISDARASVLDKSARAEAFATEEIFNAKREMATAQRTRAESARVEAETRMASDADDRARLDAQMAADRAEYKSTLAKAGKGTWGDAIMSGVEILGETLRASSRGEVPQYGAIFDRAKARAAQTAKGQIDAKMGRIKTTGDEITDMQRLQRERAAEVETVQAAELERIEDEFRGKADAATIPLEKIQFTVAADQAKVERESLTRKATETRLENDRKRSREDAEFDLKRRKTEADITKTGAETAKITHRGFGGGSKATAGGALPAAFREAIASKQMTEKDAKYAFERSVVDPTTGEPMRRGDGSFVIASDTTIANDLNEAGATIASSNALINEAVAIRGAAGWEPTSDWFGSENGRRMAGLSTQILLMNRDVYKLGVLTADDERLLKRLQGGDLQGMPDPRPNLLDIQRRQQEAYNQRIKTMAQGSQGVEFSHVKAAPKQSLEDMDTVLTQRPRLDAAEVMPSAKEKIGTLKSSRERHIQDAGDVAGGATKFVERTKVTIKQGEAHRATLQKALVKELPENYLSLQGEAVKAKAIQISLQASPTATGEELNAANLRVAKAQKAIHDSVSPKARKYARALSDQGEYLRAAEAMVADDEKSIKELKAKKKRDVERHQAYDL